MPSRLSTARPLRRPISMASLGLTTPSMAAAMIGIWKRWPHNSHEMSTSLGLMVSAPGTSAMSSKPYAARALRPRPTHMPMRCRPLQAWTAPCPQAPYIENRPLRPTVFRGEYTDGLTECQPASRSPHVRGMRELPDDAQPLDREIGVDHVDAARDPSHPLGEAAGGHYLDVRPHLRAHPLHHPVNEPRPSIHDAGLDVGDGVAPDGLLRLEELDAVQARGPGDQRLRRGDHAGGDGAAHELTARVHAVERGGGPEVDHDERLAVQSDAAHDIAHTVGAHLVGCVDDEGDDVAVPGLHGKRRNAEVGLRHRLQRLLHGRDNVGDGHARHPWRLDPARGEERLDEHTVLVGRLLSSRGEPPRDEEPRAVEDADLGVGVADLNHQ